MILSLKNNYQLFYKLTIVCPCSGTRVVHIHFVPLSFAFLSFPGTVVHSMILFHNSGQCAWSAAGSQLWDHKTKQLLHLHLFCTCTDIYFSLILFNTLHDIFNAYYMISFVLDDCTQLQINVSVLNRFKFALTKLCLGALGWVRQIQMHFWLMIFSTYNGFIRV